MNQTAASEPVSDRVAERPLLFLGIDLGGTSIKGGVVDDDAHCLTDAPETSATEADRGIDHSLKNMVRVANRAVESAGVDWDAIVGVGLGSPGTMDLPSGTLLDPVNLNGPGWENFPLRDELQKLLGKPVTFQNDANAAAYGEFWAGAGQHVDSMVLFTLGTGIGGGIIIHDQIIEGQHSHGAECGHHTIAMRDRTGPLPRLCGCGRYGCLEAYASATALLKRAEEGLQRGKASDLAAIWQQTPLGQRASLIDQLSKRGDQFCRTLMRDTAYYIAIGAVNLMHIINPDMVVLGGGMTASGAEFLGWVRESVRELAFPTPAEKTDIRYALLGGNAGYIGAAGCARQAYHSNRPTNQE